jgi:transketolase
MKVTPSKTSRAISDTPYLEALHQLAADDENVICLTCSELAKAHLEGSPNRVPQSLIHLPEGISAAVTFCAGLASEGFKPFLHASASALSRAGYEAIVNQIAAPRLPVRIIGFDAGLSHPGGVAGQAIDDLSLLNLPNFTVAEPGDAQELIKGLPLLHEIDGPVYLRAPMSKAPRLFDGQPSLTEPRILSEGTDLLVVSMGQCTAEILRLSDALKNARVSMTHLHLFTLHPVPQVALKNHFKAQKYKGLITLESHLTQGGLGSVITELLCGEQIQEHLFPIYRLGLQKTFAQGGKRNYLYKKYGVDVGAFLAAVESILKRKIGIRTADLPPSPWGTSSESLPIR